MINRSFFRKVKRYGVVIGAVASTVTVMHYCFTDAPKLWLWGMQHIPHLVTLVLMLPSK